MTPVSVVAIFCEDIRNELAGQNTIVGTFPDNLVIENPPPMQNARALLPRLGVYMRINLDANTKPKKVEAKVINTNGDLVSQFEWSDAVLEKAFTDSRSNNMPVVGLILKFVAGPFQIEKSGKVIALAIIDGTEYMAGALNITIPSPIVSEQPALQSPTAS